MLPDIQKIPDDEKQPTVASPIEPVVSAELRDLLHAIDSMCECWRADNRGEAREWVRHVNNAYDLYQESVGE